MAKSESDSGFFGDDSIWTKDGRMTDFAKNLKEAEFQNFESDTDNAVPYLKLNHLFLHDTHSKKKVETFSSSEKEFNWIFVRPCVKKLWEEVYGVLSTKGANEKKQFKGSAMLKVTGNEGIGKSYSMLYLLKLFLDEGKCVFFDSRKECYVYAFIPKKENATSAVVYDVYVTATENFKGNSRKALLESWQDIPPPVLWDPSESDSENFKPSYLQQARTVLAVSIKEDLVNNAYKNHAAGTWYMPQYTLPKIEIIRQNTTGRDRLDARLVRYRYYRYGGILRLVLGSENELEYFDKMVDRIIASLSLDVIEELLKRNCIGDNYKAVSTGIFSVNPISNENFGDRTIDFGSPYVYARLMDKCWSEYRRTGERMDKRYPSLYEAIFNVAHSQLVKSLEDFLSILSSILKCHTCDTLT